MGGLKIFNTQSGKVESVADKKVGIYVCGITPYDTTHLGHAFTFISYDVLVRYLRYRGREVTYVQNVTDIDDDILKRAKEVGLSWRQLGDRETKKYLGDMEALNWRRPDYYVQATDSVPQIVKIVKELIAEGYAYVVGGSVYFEVKKDPQFGKRLNRFKNYAEMLALANERGNFANDPNKRDALDFVLWQAAKPGEPIWNSPWGKGRPGWHIECSAMSSRYLDLPVTIHGGGADLRFPHHEGELSQAKVFRGPFVKVWMHAAMVYMNGEKMSKSLGNMVFVADLLKKYSANTVRWYLLSHHYRRDWEWNETEFKRAVSDASRFESDSKSAKKSNAEELKKKFLAALDNDLDTPTALAILMQIKEVNRGIARELAREVLGFMIK